MVLSDCAHGKDIRFFSDQAYLLFCTLHGMNVKKMYTDKFEVLQIHHQSLLKQSLNHLDFCSCETVT